MYLNWIPAPEDTSQHETSSYKAGPNLKAEHQITSTYLLQKKYI
jgi:hypothetical protein